MLGSRIPAKRVRKILNPPSAEKAKVKRWIGERDNATHIRGKRPLIWQGNDAWSRRLERRRKLAFPLKLSAG